MAFVTGYNAVMGTPRINLNGGSDVADIPLTTVVKGFDDALGEGDFIFLPAPLGGVNANDMCVFSRMPGSLPSVITQALGASSGRLCCVAMSTMAQGRFGWYQITGLALVNAKAATVAGAPYISDVAGQVFSTVTATQAIRNARIETPVGVPVAGKCYMNLGYPAVQGG